MAKILVVDDETSIREFLKTMLGREGYEVVTVPTAAQALDKLSQTRFDLVLADFKLYDENGTVLVKKIRATNTKLPIIIYSGALTADLEKEVRLAGANEVLNKGLGNTALSEQIKKFIKAQGRVFVAGERLILIVDDEASIRNMLKIFFKGKGYTVVEAENGQAALSAIAQQPVSVVLLDMEMPVMDGLTTLEKILEAKPGTGVVMVTGVQSDDRVRQALQKGACDYVLKPFDFLYLELVVLSKLTAASA